MAVVCEKGVKNKNIPINMGILRFKILKMFSLVCCSLNFNSFLIESVFSRLTLDIQYRPENSYDYFLLGSFTVSNTLCPYILMIFKMDSALTVSLS